MSRRVNRRGIFLRRQVILLCVIAAMFIGLFWLVQSTYDMIPAGEEVKAEQESEGSDEQRPPLIIWQGSSPYKIAKQTMTEGNSYAGFSSGDGRLLYCMYMSKQSSSKLLEQVLQEHCLQADSSQLPDAAGVDGAKNDSEVESGSDSVDQSGEGSAKGEEPYAGIVYLTFDDGPSHITSSILDILADEEIKATFFVLGELVEKHPHIAQRIVKDGHSIGNHSYNHRYQELYQSASIFVDQVLKTSKVIYDATGIVTPLFRAPGGTYGNFDESYMKGLKEAGYLVFDWNVDSRDSSSRDITAEEIVANVTEASLKERMIVLMHDSATHAETVEALPYIIDYFEELKYEFAVITEETEPITSPIALSSKWKRALLSDKLAKKLKTETELLLAQAAETKAEDQVEPQRSYIVKNEKIEHATKKESGLSSMQATDE